MEYHVVLSFITKSSQQFVLDQPGAIAVIRLQVWRIDKRLHRTLERFDPGSEDVFREEKYGQNVENKNIYGKRNTRSKIEWFIELKRLFWICFRFHLLCWMVEVMICLLLFNSYQPTLSKCCRSVLPFDERHQPADSMRRCGVMGNTPTSHLTKKILTDKKTASRSTCCI